MAFEDAEPMAPRGFQRSVVQTDLADGQEQKLIKQKEPQKSDSDSRYHNSSQSS